VIVLDASSAIEWLLQTPTGRLIEKRIYSRNPSLHTIHLFDLEVAQLLGRLVREKTITEQRAREALQDLIDLRITRYPHVLLLPRVWQLRPSLSAYDAGYIALAELLGAPLVTGDRKLAAASGHAATVEVF
jgi:predicted nucleic acid-binding protein